MTRTLRTLLWTLVWTTLGSTLTGCGGDSGSATYCRYDGKIYSPGDGFRAIDGCNSCRCGSDGQVACTELACLAATCLYNGKTYNAGASFPASDGCNTCQCDASGAVGCSKVLCPSPPSTTWLITDPVQCASNPWERITSKGDGSAPVYPDPELLSIDNFFEDQGVNLIELGLLYPASSGGVCTACNCPRGDSLLVRASTSDLAKLKTFGFTEVGPSDAYGLVARQCVNPWTFNGSIGTKAEVASAQSWLSQKGALVSRSGFVFHTDPVASCLACNCPRGDILATFPQNATAVGILTSLQFTLLSR